MEIEGNLPLGQDVSKWENVYEDKKELISEQDSSSKKGSLVVESVEDPKLARSNWIERSIDKTVRNKILLKCWKIKWSIPQRTMPCTGKKMPTSKSGSCCWKWCTHAQAIGECILSQSVRNRCTHLAGCSKPAPNWGEVEVTGNVLWT